MRSVVFVAPLFREGSNRFLQAFARVPDIRLGVIAMEPAERIPADLRAHIHAHFQVRDAMSADELARGARGIAPLMGVPAIDRLVAHLEELQIPVADARERLGIEGMHGAAARNFREKDRMKAVLREAGVTVARSRLLTSDNDVAGFVAEVGFPIVLKPPAGLGARATFRVKDDTELAAALSRLSPTPASPYQAEEYVDGRENTCETVTIDGRHVWRSGTHYLPGPLEVLENPWMQYCVLLPREVDDPDFRDFDAVNGRALDALGMRTGLSHMEWFRRRDGSVMVNEVGARPPGACIMPLMSHAHGCDMWAKWAELMAHDRFEAPTRLRAAGVAFFRGQGKGKVVAVKGLAEAQAEVGVHVVDRRLPTIGQPKATSYEGEGWAVVAHEDNRVVAHALRRLIELVRIEYG
ncbi:MAG: ATP-grasp domain-containing protein [Deltaproteobacteria bacterium]|nr:ATP-grasp domain-containing protein [Deltaproteobacteria bacterium]